jgi:hypothetical protein
MSDPLIVLNCPCDALPLLLSADSVGRRIDCPHSNARFVVPEGRPFGVEDWRACQLPSLVMSYLAYRGHRPSPRKSRLLACATCRLYWERLPHECCRRGVEVAERFADGEADERERQAAQADAVLLASTLWRNMPTREAARWAYRVADTLAVRMAFTTALFRLRSLTEPSPEECALLRDVIGDPFRPVPIRPHWLTWDVGRVVALARNFYQQRRFDLLPVLSDALEDAGCDSADLLSHLRGPGPHVPGCWALDLLLGKG